MNRNTVSYFPHTAKWHSLDTGVSTEIETDIVFEFQASMVPNNSQTMITIKHNSGHTF